MDGFQYEKPTSVAQAAALLAGAHGRAKILAGGTDLLVAMRSGLSQPELVVDVKHIPAMTEISWTGDGELVIGAAVEVGRIAEDPRIGEVFPALAEGAGAIGSLQVRCRATVGGNLANASPCMDTAPPLLVLGAQVQVASQAGERRIPLAALLRRREADRARARGARDRDRGAEAAAGAAQRVREDQARVRARPGAGQRGGRLRPGGPHAAGGDRKLRGDAGAAAGARRGRPGGGRRGGRVASRGRRPEERLPDRRRARLGRVPAGHGRPALPAARRQAARRP